MHKKLYRQYFFWLMGSASFILQVVVQLSSGLVAPYLSDEFSLGPFYGNILVSSVFFLHILMQVPAGLLIEQMGSRQVLGFGSFISCLGALFFSWSTGFYSALFSRMLMGAGLSCSFVGLTAIIGGWFPSYQFALMISLAEMLGLFIGGLAEHWVPEILKHYSWQFFFQGISLGCFILGTCILAFLKDRQQSIHRMTFADVLSHLRLVSNQGRLWLNGLYSGAMFSVVTGFIAGDAAQMMSLMPGIDFSHAAEYCALIMYGLVVGAAFAGAASMRFTYRGVLQSMAVLGLIGSLALLMIIWGDISGLMRGLLCVLLGMSSAGYLLSFRIAGDLMSLGKGRGILMGFTNMLSVLIGPLLSVLAGLIQRVRLEDQGSVLLDAHVKLYGFQLTSSLFVVALLFGSILAMILLRMRDD
ncbi:MFS transporter [Gammaproteobacteria bacterium]|nr:MFS transporter [Gammaproteobacteria bacterium]